MNAPSVSKAMPGLASELPVRTGSALGALREESKLYRELAKSGIVTLVLISVLGGYLIGQPPELPFRADRMFLTLFGVLFLASGSSALNQLQEWRIDASMPRTAKRPIPSGRMTPRGVAWFVGLTLAVGLALLAQVSWAVTGLGIAAVASYNGLYTLWWKRYWAYGAVPGAIPGALPILMGYAAADGRVLTPGGIYLFLLLFYWQMPHFWVLALRFRSDYSLGKIPTLPVARGEKITKLQIAVWCLAYVALALLAPLFLRTGRIYGVTSIIVGAKVLWELMRFTRLYGTGATLRADTLDAGTPPQPKPQSPGPGWLRFFLWVNFSLILYVAAAALDLWGFYWFAVN